MLGSVAVLLVHLGQDGSPPSGWIEESRLVAGPWSMLAADLLWLLLARKDSVEEYIVPHLFDQRPAEPYPSDGHIPLAELDTVEVLPVDVECTCYCTQAESERARFDHIGSSVRLQRMHFGLQTGELVPGPPGLGLVPALVLGRLERVACSQAQLPAAAVRQVRVIWSRMTFLGALVAQRDR